MNATPVPCGHSVITARRSDLHGWAGYGYCPSHSRWYWGAKLLLICTCDGTVTGFGLANPKLSASAEQARQLPRISAPDPAPPPNTGPAAITGLCGRLGVIGALDRRSTIKQRERGSEAGEVLTRARRPS